MPTTMLNHAYDQRFLMLPVSPARSTDSQQDASCHSKHSISHSSSADDVITEALMLSAGSLCLPTKSASLSTTSAGSSSASVGPRLYTPVFRPTEWRTPRTTTGTTNTSSTTAVHDLFSSYSAPPLESFWMIRRSYAFDEDEADDEDEDDDLKEEREL
jgi:hypothetical protein